MKHKIFLIITLLTILAVNVSAQVVKNSPKILTQDEKDKLEVVKFADEFVRILEKTKDIGLIPNKFFDDGFKANLIKTYKSEFIDEFKFIGQISDNEVYDFVRLSLNLFYLAMSIHNGLCCEDFELNNNPPNIVKIIKKSKFLLGFYGEGGSELNINNIAELNSIKAELKEVTKEQRKYLEKLSPKKKAIIRKNLLSTINKFDCFKVFQCGDKECENFPQKTRMAEFCLFPLILKIVKVGDTFKILNFYPYSQ